ncbi:hypothetical protein DMC47_39775 [Nostoc sp. 3335mG]|nr:hypothetical protein DMC47_39775 [Nostoc sp. 3335mG]
MRKALILSTLFAGTMLAAAPAWADDAPAAPASDFTITGSAGVWSQYRFRGISQSDNKPVVQGSLTLTHSSGLYLSTWGSSATGNSAVDIGGTEIDVYAGYSKTISGWTLDGGLYGYIYPGSTRVTVQIDPRSGAIGGSSGISQNYFEVYGDIAKTYGPVTAKVGVNFAPNQSYFKNFNTATRHNFYVFGELGFSLPSLPVSFHTHLGHTGGGFDYAGHQYFDYTVGATYKWKSLAFDISLVGTTVKKRNTTEIFDDGEDGVAVFTNNDYRRAAKPVAVASISASF